MCTTAGAVQRGAFRRDARLRTVGFLFAFLLATALIAPARAQSAADEFVTGKAAAAWDKWQAALQPLLQRDAAKAEAAFGELLALDPSPLRIALLADRTIKRTALGGALQLFEQDIQAGKQDANAKKVGELLVAGREQLNEADDGFFFANVGRFDVSNANFKALADSNPDPVALLEFVDRVPRRHEILTSLGANSVVGESAMRVLRILDQGEMAIKADPTRIRHNIELLAGPPRSYENAVDRLKESGEYAVPYLIAALRDPNQRPLTQAILRALPQIDRAALSPLVIALQMDDPTTKRFVLEVIGQIPYPQSIPYLLKLVESDETTPEVRSAAGEALHSLQSKGVSIDPSVRAAEAFFRLGENYYENHKSLAADPRLDKANVWYWREGVLQNVEVPTAIYNEVMCMRCSWEALQLDKDHKPALALWLAADFRREAQLPEGQTDSSAPPDLLSAKYYAQSSGPEYCLMALARAVDDDDTAVALGTIDALHETAGPASTTPDRQGRLPLAEALSFPDRLVRVRAALTLAAARPERPFRNSQNLLPILAEAVQLHTGQSTALVVDPDDVSANAMAALLRNAGYTVTVNGSLAAGLEAVRTQTPSLDVIVLASNLPEPGLEAALTSLRSEFRFASTPILLLAKPGDRDRMRDLARTDHRLADVEATEEAVVRGAISRVSRAVGMQTITPEMGTALALEAARALHTLASTNNPIFNIAAARTALVNALGASNTDLRVEAANVLAYICETEAQDALANVATDEGTAEDLRVKVYEALASAAKQCGSQLGPAMVTKVIGNAEQGTNATIREAASRAMGALNLSANEASKIVRSQYRG